MADAPASPGKPETLEIRTIVGHVYTGGGAAPWPKNSTITLPAADARALVAAKHAELVSPPAQPAPDPAPNPAPGHYAGPGHDEPGAAH